MIAKIFSSRKWTVSIATGIAAILNSVFGWNVPEDTILAVIGLIAVAVGAEGYKDGKAMEGTTPPVVK